jgi:hypothetical protein
LHQDPVGDHGGQQHGVCVAAVPKARNPRRPSLPSTQTRDWSPPHCFRSFKTICAHDGA